MYDSQKDELCFVDANYLEYEERLTPIGIVVIPTSHNVYGNGKCGVVSLNCMNRLYPNTGSDYGNYTSFYWCGISDGIQGSVDTSIQNFSKVPEVDDYSSETPTIKQAVDPNYPNVHWGEKDNYMLAVQGYTERINKSDPVTGYKYQNSFGDYNVFGPSPYLKDGSRNPIYYQNTSPMTSNILSDFKGKNNTSVLCQLHGSKNPSWKTDSSVTDVYGYPPAVCCWRYSTPGTKQGDWYLPAAGEICYIPSRYEDISNALVKIRKEYPKENVLSHYVVLAWTSTESSASSAVSMLTTNGSVSLNLKYENDDPNHDVLAFLQV